MSDIVLGGCINLEGGCTNCIIHGFEMPRMPFTISGAAGVAFCPVNKIASMAASNVSLWAVLLEKLPIWKRKIFRFFNLT